jgi:hypothetical protein
VRYEAEAMVSVTVPREHGKRGELLAVDLYLSSGQTYQQQYQNWHISLLDTGGMGNKS